ncbi:NUDIX domain-containing protein [Micromonospora sp. NPDC048830]|uniref:NUDIX domain-containing protein n=1 Tax=Micromonospora sp. NPDC048830 TaxID=3364257 RepID=UPI003715AB64
MTTIARVRAACYITRPAPNGQELLVFSYPAAPDAGTHLPGGGIEPGERPDAAAVREAIEETGIQGSLALHGVVGVQQTTYDTGTPCISVYFHLVTDEPRDTWRHTVIGDADAWDTGMETECRFLPLAQAAERLRSSWHHQEAYVNLLHTARS